MSTLKVNNIQSTTEGSSIIFSNGVIFNNPITATTIYGSGGNIISSTGSTISSTSLGGGVKILFSSDTNNLAFATLSSQTPSSLRIVSSSTGVILFSAITNYQTISYSNALINQTNGTLNVGIWYRITGRNTNEFVNFNTYGDIFLQSILPNKFSHDGYLLAINADYNNIGNYTDAVSTYGTGITNTGVVYCGVTVNNKNVIIWNNIHWINTGNSVTINTNNNITTNLIPLTKNYTTRNGYNIELQKITYNLSSNTIYKIEDSRGNIVTSNPIVVEYFRYGDDSVTNNKVYETSGVEIINTPNVIFKNNTFIAGAISNFYSDVIPNVTLNIQNSVINYYRFGYFHLNSYTLSIANVSNQKITQTDVKSVSLTSQNIYLDSDLRDIITISSTGGTFNGVITSITSSNAIDGIYRFNISNSLTNRILTFRNSELLKTKGGADFVLSSSTVAIGSSIEFEFYPSTQKAYLINYNNYLS